MAETAVLEQVLLAPAMERDYQSRQAADRFIGACLLHAEVDVSFAEPAEQFRPIESLYDALLLAHEGDERAREMIAINVRTDVIERTIKAGHIIEVDLDVDEAGRIQQFGQSMESVHANSLRHVSNSPQMLARTSAETTNAFRIADYYREGLFTDYNLVVFSRAADDMSESDMRAAGFFTDTMSLAIQVTSAQEGLVTTESAFVAGKASPQAPRRDRQAMVSVGQALDVDLSGLSATELLATPLLVPKSTMPNGVVDIVRLYDEALGDTFFGQARPVQNYYSFKQVCKEREQQYEPLVATITEQLIAEAPQITDRTAACERLHQLSQEYMVDQTGLGDRTIDARVFGPASSIIEQARVCADNGRMVDAMALLQLAKKIAVSSSCPTGKNGITATENQSSDNASDQSADCEFVSKSCPKCHKKNVLTRVSKGSIKGSCGCSAKL